MREAYGALPHRIDPKAPVEVKVCTDDENILQRMLDLDETVNQADAVKPFIAGQLSRAGSRWAAF